MMARDWSQEFFDDAAEGRCFKCRGPLVFHGDKARGSHFFEQECIGYLQAELREWRSGKRRVFGWRVTHRHGVDKFRTLRDARWFRTRCGGTITRVTVGPAKKPAKKKEAG